MDANSETSPIGWVDRILLLLAGQHSLDRRRVLPVCIRAQQLDDDYGPAFVGIVEDAISHLGPLEALELLEKEEFEWLLYRIKSYPLLKGAFSAPVCSLVELAELARDFIPYLESNREHLLETGYPRTSFGPSAFFDMMLSRLYYVKLPLRDPFYPREWLQDQRVPGTESYGGPPTTRVRRLDDGSYEYDYVWAKEPASLPSEDQPGFCIYNEKGALALSSGFIWDDKLAYTDDGTPVTPCEYEGAARIAGLSDEDAARVQQLRGKVLECKLLVLEKLALAARAEDCSGLWSGCVKILSRNLLASDAAFLMDVDRLCVELQLGCEICYGHSILKGYFHTGGLSDLLTLIGHFEKEIAIGTMCKTKQALDSLPQADLPKSYFQAIGEPWQRALDRTIDQFFGLNLEESAFWMEYEARVNQVLEEELYEELNLRVRVKAKLKHPYQPFALSFLELTKALQEDTGRLPELRDILAVGSVPPPEPVFRKGVGCWNVNFGGKPVVLTAMVGVEYIAFLLQHPDQEFDVLTLVRTVRGNPTSMPNREYSDMSTQELETEELYVGGFDDAGEAIDAEYEADCRKRLKAAQEELKRAKLRNDGDTIAQANNDIRQYRRSLSEGVDRDGRRRKAGDPAESARIAVRQAIGRVLAKLRDNHPALYEHLDSSIHTGSSCCYRPSTPTARVPRPPGRSEK